MGWKNFKVVKWHIDSDCKMIVINNLKFNVIFLTCFYYIKCIVVCTLHACYDVNEELTLVVNKMDGFNCFPFKVAGKVLTSTPIQYTCLLQMPTANLENHCLYDLANYCIYDMQNTTDAFYTWM